MYSIPIHPNMRQSDIIDGGNNYADSSFELCFFFLSWIGTTWTLVSHYKILQFESKSTVTQYPPPRNQENMHQFDCSWLAKVAYIIQTNAP